MNPRSRGEGRPLVWTALLSGAAVLLVGCGGGEQTFTADEFVEAMNEQGAAVALGPDVTTSEDGVPVRSVILTEAATPASAPAPGQDVHGSGTMLVMEDTDGARDEIGRCETTTVLVCYRAANVVLRFEGLLPEEQARITTAISGLASD